MVLQMTNSKILLFILMIFFLISFSSAATLSVNGTGANCLTGTQTNYSTIQSAVTAASAGDTVYVCRNSTIGYTENIVINKSINLYGNESGVLVNASSASLSVFYINESYVNITNFTLTGSTSVSSSAFEANTTANSTHAYNIVINNSRIGFSILSSNNTIENNTVYNISHNGIYLYYSHYNNINNNIVYILSSDTYAVNIHLNTNSTYNNFHNNRYCCNRKRKVK